MNKATDRSHFDRLAPAYNHYRALDEEPVRFLAQSLPGTEHEVCELGCGTGRYIFALLRHMSARGLHVKRCIGIDASSNMLEVGRSEADKRNVAVEFMEGRSDATGLVPGRLSLMTSFNSIHYFPIKSTLEEIERVLRPGGRFAVYTRLREQEDEHIWGKWFPRYVEFSIAPPSDFMSRLSDHSRRFKLILSRRFTFERQTSLSVILEQTKNKFYSTLGRYPENAFDDAYEAFVDNLKFHYADPNNINYPSSYSLFVYERAQG